MININHTTLYIKFIGLAILLISKSTIAQNNPVTNQGKDFVIFESMGYKGRPDDLFKTYGLINMPIYGHRDFFENYDIDVVKPDFQRVKNIADKSIKKNQKLVTLDIELWDFEHVNEQTLKTNISNYALTAAEFKKYTKDVKIGFYSTLPIRNYWAPVKAKKDPGHKKYNEWHLLNTYLHPISDQVDVIFPSLYTFYEDKEGWVTYAEEMLKEAKKYNKPVYVYLCPQYHASNLFKGWDFIEGEYWRMQLEIAYKHADGIVFWSRKLNASDWDGDREWWLETTKFMNKIGYVNKSEKYLLDR